MDLLRVGRFILQLKEQEKQGFCLEKGASLPGSRSMEAYCLQALLLDITYWV
jgi:hypothetical protein